MSSVDHNIEQHESFLQKSGTAFRFMFFIILLIFMTGTDSVFAQKIDADTSADHMVLKNDSILYGDIRFKRDEFNNIIILYNDSLVFKINEIKSVRNQAGSFFTMQRMVTISDTKRFENLLLKTVHPGRISVYTCYNPLHAQEDNKQYQYFRLGAGNIREVNSANLRSALADHKPSLDLIDRYDFYKKLSRQLLWIGLTSVVYGYYSERSEAGIVGYFGLTCILGGSVFIFLKNKNLERIIDRYNSVP